VTARFADPNVKAVFDAYPPKLRARLLALRDLIFATAKATKGVGPLTETLKWGQPSYLTMESGSGTTIRIDRVRSTKDQYALYVHCQTKLVTTFRAHYPRTFTYAGNRGVIFGVDNTFDQAALRHCVGLALTHHRRKRG
jgi:hypothetical protein